MTKRMVQVLVQIWSTWTSAFLQAPPIPAAFKGLRNWFGGTQSPSIFVLILFSVILFYFILIYLVFLFRFLFLAYFSFFCIFLNFFNVYFCSLCQNFEAGEMLEPKEKPRKFRSLRKFCSLPIFPSLLHSYFVCPITFSSELRFR